MPSILPRLVALAVLPVAVLTMAQPAWSFASFSATEAVGDNLTPDFLFGEPYRGYLHKNITLAGLNGLGISETGLHLVAWRNYLQDWEQMHFTGLKLPTARQALKCAIRVDPTGLKATIAADAIKGAYQPGDHFDRNPSDRGDHQAAFKRGLDRLKSSRAVIIDKVNRGEMKAALEELGRATHRLQDFYSHSNWVDLSAGEQARLDGILLGSSQPVPAGLKITGYDPDGKETNDPFPHDDFCKDDDACHYPEGQEIIAGKKKHKLAVEAAVRATRGFAQSIRRQTLPGQWARLKFY